MNHLPPSLFEQFQLALCDAFPSKSTLSQMVRVQLDQNLDFVAGGDTLQELTFNLIVWAESRGNLEVLVSGAIDENPNNPKLKNFDDTWQTAALEWSTNRSESDMDIPLIASTVVTLLTPYLSKAGEAAAKKGGEAAWQAAARVYQVLAEKMSGDPDSYAAQTFNRFEEKPDSRGDSLEDILVELLNDDSDLASVLATLVTEANDSNSKTEFNTNIFGGEVGEVINIDKVEGGFTINKEQK